jgi:hypothetical protein
MPPRGPKVSEPLRDPAHPPVRIPREHLPHRSSGSRADRARHLPTTDTGSRRDCVDNTGDNDPCNLGVSAMRRRDDRRAHPLAAPDRHRDLRFRHVMMAHDLATTGAFIHVLTHRSGAGYPELRHQRRIVRRRITRAPDRADAVAAHAPTAAQLTPVHAPGS